MTPEEKEQLLSKDVMDLTPEDIEELNQILEEENGTKELVKQFADSAIYSAALDYIEILSTEGAKEGVIAFLNAFIKYSKARKGTVHELFTDPNLPEILEQIRDKAKAEFVSIAKKYGVEVTQETGRPRPITEEIISGEMMAKGKFHAVYNGELVREFARLKKTDFTEIEYDDRSILTADTKNGPIRLINPDEMYSKFIESFGPMALKLFFMGLVGLARKNYYDKASAKNLRIDLSFSDFAKAQNRNIEAAPNASPEEKKKAQNRRKDFINEINRNLTDLSHFSWQIEGKGKYRKIGILQTSHRIENNTITFYFDQGFADAIRIDGIMTQSPTALLYTDNRDPNAYKIGLYVANHHGNDRNAARGTESTLSIKSLISAAATIPTFEELRSQGRRDWKVKIKKPLERSLNDFIRVDYLEKWEYRHPRTGKRYTEEKAEELSAATYEELMVDYTVKNAPDMKERRERREQERREREQKQIEAGLQPKRRGRPKKRVAD